MVNHEAAIEERVDSIFVELFEFQNEQLSPEKRLFEDLGLDSLDAIDMVIRFQKEFRIKPSTQEIQKLKTLNDVYTLIRHQTIASNSVAVS